MGNQQELKIVCVEILKAYQEVAKVMRKIEKEQKEYFEKLLSQQDASKIQALRASLKKK